MDFCGKSRFSKRGSEFFGKKSLHKNSYARIQWENHSEFFWGDMKYSVVSKYPAKKRNFKA